MARLALSVINAQAEIIRLALNNGYIRIYSGTRPSEPENSTGASTLLAELRISNPSSSVSTIGELVVNVLEEDSTLAAGVANWARVLQSDGTTVIEDCSVSSNAGTADIIISPTNSIAINKRLSITYTHKINRGT